MGPELGNIAHHLLSKHGITGPTEPPHATQQAPTPVPTQQRTLLSVGDCCASAARGLTALAAGLHDCLASGVQHAGQPCLDRSCRACEYCVCVPEKHENALVAIGHRATG